MRKFFLISVFIVSYFWLFGFSHFYYSLSVQFCGFVAVSIYFVARFSIEEYWSTLVVIIPLVVMYGVFGMAFYMLSLSGRNDWLEDTFIKIIFLPSSVLFARAALSHISFNDIAELNISEEKKTDLVVFRTIVVRGSQSMKRLKWYIDNFQRHFGKSLLRHKLPKYSALILSTYVMLYKQAEVLYKVIENRKSYLSKEYVK